MRVGLIHRGELLLTGSPQAIKATFKGDLLEIRTDDLRTATKVLNQLVVNKGRLVQQVHVTGERLMVTVNDSSQALEPLKEALQNAGLEH